MPRLIDTHAHLNLEAYDVDRRQVIENARASGVFMINVGVNYASSLRALEIAQEYGDGIWAAIGLHPESIEDDYNPHAKEFRNPEDAKEAGFDYELYCGLARSSDKVVAIGEAGLDYLHSPKDKIAAAWIRDKQAEVFKRQLVLARELGLPVIIHTRMAHEDTLGILRGFAGLGGNVNGVIHCFTGSADEMRQYRDLGLYFGITGIIFKLDLNEAIVRMPLDHILLETDCPFLSPVPGVKRNEPKFVLNVAERVAQIRSDSVDAIIKAATENAKRLFKIG